MSDEELLIELQAKALELGMDIRFLIIELIKRYQVRKFEVATLRKRIDRLTGPPWDDV